MHAWVACPVSQPRSVLTKDRDSRVRAVPYRSVQCTAGQYVQAEIPVGQAGMDRAGQQRSPVAWRHLGGLTGGGVRVGVLTKT